MPATRQVQPVAARATAFIGSSRWLNRPVRMVRYDALWPDGRVEFNVSLTTAMYRGWPADFAPIEDSVHDNCPEVGTGRWVNEFAKVIDGPAERDPNPPVVGIRRVFGATRREPNPRVRRAWRLSVGVVGLGLGILLLIGPARAGVIGLPGALCCFVGLMALAGLIPVKRR
ncbi:hypothetical protein [Cryobacterium sp. AP23]